MLIANNFTMIGKYNNIGELQWLKLISIEPTGDRVVAALSNDESFLMYLIFTNLNILGS